jgi:hypothetical protein
MDLIVNGSNGMYWYPKGSERLAKSLDAVGWTDYKIYNQYSLGLYDESCPYTIKADILHTAAMLTTARWLLWVDCSAWAIRNPKPIFDIIKKDGYYFWTSGYNAAQTCSDKCLDYFGINRDTAETYQDAATGIFGIDLHNEIGYNFFKQWSKAALDGVFNGSRFHDNQSEDPRFLFHRQDQSVASCLIGKMGLKFNHDDLCKFDGQEDERTIFKLKGM